MTTSRGPGLRHALLHDADCGFCVRSARWVQRLGCDVEMVAWQDFDELAAYAITPEAAHAEIHLVDGDRVLRGHEAIAGALRRSSYAVVRAAGAVLGSRAVRPVASRSYTWVAAHRQSLPGGTATCSLEERKAS
ncbi:hypothetical protein GCM10011519_27410 [Marmoricola endophyticus]|uniref:DUF393 domain-containing protein n=1 Tax=Marmoricola endophyticus TaxID=2040280 RepID=A0A917BPE4_9ACTN|nr:DUF393 domain-containing protein [Marmoricola endophyticus]GGF51901.1 hypothetical protein GCM10011519_27410 [Marmoricola endophyticus]